MVLFEVKMVLSPSFFTIKMSIVVMQMRYRIKQRLVVATFPPERDLHPTPIRGVEASNERQNEMIRNTDVEHDLHVLLFYDIYAATAIYFYATFVH